jgi:hypothetical protein
VERNQSFGRSKKSSILLCYFDIYFFKITNDFAGTEETVVSVSAIVYFFADADASLNPSPK